jgi:hypothetical protein
MCDEYYKMLTLFRREQSAESFGAELRLTLWRASVTVAFFDRWAIGGCN